MKRAPRDDAERARSDGSIYQHGPELVVEVSSTEQELETLDQGERIELVRPESLAAHCNIDAQCCTQAQLVVVESGRGDLVEDVANHIVDHVFPEWLDSQCRKC